MREGGVGRQARGQVLRDRLVGEERAGTVLGFAIGGAIVGVLGTDHALLWSLLPVVILVAASAPTVIPFIAGQAAFTVFTIILFNILAPAGWRIGVVRIEDVGLGCAASLVAGLLFWPRGAAVALATAISEAYRTSADYLQDSMRAVTGRRSSESVSIGSTASAAGSRLDDALRQYLAEQGAKHVPLSSVTALANGATRLRLAGAAISRLQDAVADRQIVPPGDDGLGAPADVLARRGEQVTDWYLDLAAGFARPDASFPTTDGTRWRGLAARGGAACRRQLR